MFAFAAVAVIGILPMASANGQNYGAVYGQPAPLYPYAANDPVQRDYDRYVRSRRQPDADPSRQYAPPRASKRQRKTTDRVLVEELRQGKNGKRIVFDKKTVVHEKPVVIEKRRIVDVPVVIERKRYVDEPVDEKPQRKRAQASAGANAQVRVIRAEAEVRIIGKDEMSIKLYRKGGAPAASAD